MALGRIKRGSNLAKRFDVKARKFGPTIRESTHAMKIDAQIGREDRNYIARVCFRTRGDVRGGKYHYRSCEYGAGRSPQSALAKALKRFSATVAKRGRK